MPGSPAHGKVDLHRQAPGYDRILFRAFRLLSSPLHFFSPPPGTTMSRMSRESRVSHPSQRGHEP